MVSEERRQSGGQSNRKGNRYEDAFAVFRSIQLAPDVIHRGQSVRLWEQAGCHVDDLVIHHGLQTHYYQLKDHQTITWGAQGGKLREAFADQMEQCRNRQEDFTLTIVVSHDDRKQSLDDSMPDELKGTVTVHLFPAVQRPSELAQREALRESLHHISASRSPGPELLQGLAEGFHLAWVERAIDAKGIADLGLMVAFLRERPSFRLHRPLPDSIHPMWDRFLQIVSGISGLQYQYERGYLEWSWGSSDSGLVDPPCDSESFRRFVDRVLEKPPTTFEEFEKLLP